MLIYHPLCLAGAPRRALSAEAVELQNFAVFRDDKDQILGFGLSDGELSSPVLGLSIDRDAQRIWVRPERDDRYYYVALSLLPADALSALDQARLSEKPFSIFAVNTSDEPDQAPMEVAA